VAEITRREIFIFPILAELCDYLEVMLNDEYYLSVNQWLKGNLDYYIKTANHRRMLVIEAKQSDLTRGFTQLAAELAALDLRSPTQLAAELVPLDLRSPTQGEITVRLRLGISGDLASSIDRRR
jgi:hypothetical protein